MVQNRSQPTSEGAYAPWMRELPKIPRNGQQDFLDQIVGVVRLNVQPRQPMA
jgi:hypothetical protein